MSDISQLANGVGGEGEWGTKVTILLHYLAQGEGQGGGFRSLPLGKAQFMELRYTSGPLPFYAVSFSCVYHNLDD